MQPPPILTAPIRAGRAPVLRIPWSRTPAKRRREIIAPAQSEHPDHRPIRAETRATLVRAIALGRRWLDELVTGAMAGPKRSPAGRAAAGVM